MKGVKELLGLDEKGAEWKVQEGVREKISGLVKEEKAVGVRKVLEAVVEEWK